LGISVVDQKNARHTLEALFDLFHFMSMSLVIFFAFQNCGQGENKDSLVLPTSGTSSTDTEIKYSVDVESFTVSDKVFSGQGTARTRQYPNDEVNLRSDLSKGGTTPVPVTWPA